MRSIASIEVLLSSRLRTPLVAAAFVAVLLTACSSGTAGQVAGGASDIHLTQSHAQPPHSSVAAMVERILPSVVNVRLTDVTVNPFGQQREMKAEGSGVVVDRHGVISPTITSSMEL